MPALNLPPEVAQEMASRSALQNLHMSVSVQVLTELAALDFSRAVLALDQVVERRGEQGLMLCPNHVAEAAMAYTDALLANYGIVRGPEQAPPRY